MFDNYIYQSGISSSFQLHFEELANYICNLGNDQGYVLEIGSNDGLLLNKLKQLGINCVGVEPSLQLVEVAHNQGLEAHHGFWNQDSKNQIVSKYGSPKIIVANNVFAHIEDMRSTTALISEVLDSDGYFVFEVSYFADVFENNLFDTIYHEHMSYHTMTPLIKFFEDFEMKIINVDRISIHGGSIRVTVAKNLEISVDVSVKALVQLENQMKLNDPDILNDLRIKIKNKKDEVWKLLQEIEENGFVFGFAAPAKLVTFLSVMDMEKIHIVGIIDDNPLKQGKFLPGSGIEIMSSVSMSGLLETKLEVIKYCFVFAWNIGEELLGKLRNNFPKGLNVIQFVPDVSSVEL